MPHWVNRGTPGPVSSGTLSVSLARDGACCCLLGLPLLVEKQREREKQRKSGGSALPVPEQVHSTCCPGPAFSLTHLKPPHIKARIFTASLWFLGVVTFGPPNARHGEGSPMPS